MKFEQQETTEKCNKINPFLPDWKTSWIPQSKSPLFAFFITQNVAKNHKYPALKDLDYQRRTKFNKGGQIWTQEGKIYQKRAKFTKGGKIYLMFSVKLKHFVVVSTKSGDTLTPVQMYLESYWTLVWKKKIVNQLLTKVAHSQQSWALRFGSVVITSRSFSL